MRPFAWALVVLAALAIALVALAPARRAEEPPPERSFERESWSCPMVACERPGAHDFALELYVQRAIGL
ncbi:MAG: hypothetical protein KIT31_14640 [Deltaproteobacteria bacterium]|nr:hypothetical protein [Deltaproteobacteria bacterium]